MLLIASHKFPIWRHIGVAQNKVQILCSNVLTQIVEDSGRQIVDHSHALTGRRYLSLLKPQVFHLDGVDIEGASPPAFTISRPHCDEAQ